MTDMTDMTKAEVLAIWKGFVRNMSDQGAVFPFANEIASRARNSLLANGELMHPTVAGDRYAIKYELEKSKWSISTNFDSRSGQCSRKK